MYSLCLLFVCQIQAVAKSIINHLEYQLNHSVLFKQPGGCDSSTDRQTCVIVMSDFISLCSCNIVVLDG